MSGTNNVLGAKDANLPMTSTTTENTKDGATKSMEYHRQVLQSKMEEEKYEPSTDSISTSITSISPLSLSSTSLSSTSTSSSSSSSSQSFSSTVTNLSSPLTQAFLPQDEHTISTHQEGATKKNTLAANLSRQTQRSKQSMYISPSDEIMSPCTAKLNAFRSKQAGRAKPKSLFAQASSKRLEDSAAATAAASLSSTAGEALFGSSKTLGNNP